MLDSMSKLKREDPPPLKVNRGTNWRAILDDVRTTPNEWVFVGIQPAAYVTGIKNGRLGGAKPGEFEGTIRETDSKTQKGKMWVRFIGEGGEDE